MPEPLPLVADGDDRDAALPERRLRHEPIVGAVDVEPLEAVQAV